MKKYIFINYYSDPDPARKHEYLYCVYNNASCEFIDKVFIFVENESHISDIVPSEKMVFVKIPSRMEFSHVINFANTRLEPDSVIIILNLDIFIENSEHWARIDEDFFQPGYPHKGLVCKRHNLNSDHSVWIEDYSWWKGEFCDAWVFKTPLNPNFVKEDFNFCVGNAPQCDNVMMYLMSKYMHVFSWGSKYRVYHYDVCRKGTRDSGNMIYTGKTDTRPSQRRNEHIDIPAFQDWDALLQIQKPPVYMPTWRHHLLNIEVGQ